MPVRALKAAGAFVAGFFLQFLSLDGTFASEDEDRWFRRGEWATYVFIALLAVSTVALLIITQA